LVSSEYAATQAARVSTQDPVALPSAAGPREGTHTTHLSVVDKDGLAVAMTLTINTPFGSGLVVPGTGVLLNDEMDDFYVDGPNSFGLVGNQLNAPAPGKRPLSSMSPTFVLEDHRLLAVLGSPGGSSIPSAVAWVIREMLEGNKNADEAARSPRIHDQWLPNVLEVEPNNDIKTSTPTNLEPPFAANGIIQEKGDADFFKFTAKKDQQFDVSVYARRLRSPLDSVLDIYDAKGNRLFVTGKNWPKLFEIRLRNDGVAMPSNR